MKQFGKNMAYYNNVLIGLDEQTREQDSNRNVELSGYLVVFCTMTLFHYGTAIREQLEEII
jgi:hypothetical protein